MMCKKLKAKQAYFGMTNKRIADELGIGVNTYIFKKRTGKFFLGEILKLMELFNCSFEELF